MAEPSYTTDLLDVDSADLNTKWAEMTGRTSGGAATAENRAYIQGDGSISQSTGVATGRTTGLQCDYGDNIPSWESGWVFLVWQYWQAPKAIGTWADGGMRFGVGSSAGNVKLWNAQGNDYGRNPYGGWANVAVDPEFSPADESIGTPVAGNYRIFCSAPYILLAVSKGNPHCVDAIRYKRGQLKVEYGESENYGTFSGMAEANDADSARWGLFQQISGGYLWKGLMSLGTDTNAVDFRDANRNIVIDDTPRTYADFNKSEVRNASTKCYWTAISILALGTVSRGNFEAVHDADINFDFCVFTDMGTFIFKSNSTILNTIFRHCNLITQNSAVFTSCTFEATNDSERAFLSDNLNKITYCDFISGGIKHGIELTPSTPTYPPTTINLTGVNFIGYGADGTPNAALYNNSGHAVRINVSGAAPPTVRNGAGASTELVTDQRTYSFTVKNEAGNSLTGYEWRLYEKDPTPGKIGNEIKGEESATSSTQSYVYSYTGDLDIVIQIICDGYEEEIFYDTLKNENKSITITLKEEVNI